MNTVVVTDKGLESLLAQLKALRTREGAHVQVGVFARNDQKLATIAAAHEFGSPKRGLPQRSFMRSTAYEKGKDWGDLLIAGLRQHLGKRRDLKLLFDKVGARAVADMRAKIKSGIAPPLAASTVKQRIKGFKKTKRPGVFKDGRGRFTTLKSAKFTPLWKTGALIRAITWYVNLGKVLKK